MDKKSFSKLCAPAKLYFAIAVIAIIVGLFAKVELSILIVKLIFAFIWTWILGLLCKKGWSPLSWFLVLFPYIVIILAVFRIANITQHKQIFRTVGLQGAYGQEAFGTREGANTMSGVTNAMNSAMNNVMGTKNKGKK
jgi:hypothetical protein